MLPLLAQIIGLCAVAVYLFSYQQKKRSNIILLNATSRCLYVLQYILLGAFSGAALDILGTVSSVIAGKKDTAFVRKYTAGLLITVNAVIIAVGGWMAFVNRSWLDLLPIVAVLLQTGALWLSDERRIRQVSLLAVPFWLVYNLFSRAYGSVIGDILSAFSIIVAMVRYKDAGQKTV